jgi:phage terminase large subunit
MITTRVFSETLKAYNEGFDNIANEGGTRSSKTFSSLQLFKIITDQSKRRRIITIVSHSLPHLEGGAIRDFDNILTEAGIQIERVRTKHPYIYTINKCIVEFVGFDRPGKALGAARDILLINEANKMPWTICHHLMQRTTECVFLDWNPSEEFWFDEQGIRDRKTTKTIHSNFYDNIQNLSERQLNELKEARRKALEEEKRGIKGYWWNYWQVYGLGKKGVLEGVIFPDHQVYSHLPEDVDLFKIWGVDWGGSDPTTFTELNIDHENNRLYVKEHIYQGQIRNSELIKYISDVIGRNEYVICDSARKDKIWELQMSGIAAQKCKKYPGVKLDNIDSLNEFIIFVHEDSKNLKSEFEKYKRVKDELTGKFLEEPEDANDHCIDPIGYAIEYYRRNIRPL